MDGFLRWLEQQQHEIDRPYYRLSIPAMYGTKKKPDETGSYWTPRWDAILLMIRSAYHHWVMVRGKYKEDWQVKVYKLEKAIMEDPPKEHKWAFSYAHDAGEQVLVKSLEVPQVVIDVDIDEVDNLIGQSYEYDIPIDFGTKGAEAIYRGETVYVLGNYDKKGIEVAKKDGWNFKIIKIIKSKEEWREISKYIHVKDWESYGGDALSWFIGDMEWYD